MGSQAHNILTRIFDTKAAFVSNPELFDLKKLSPYDFSILIKENQSLFLDVVAPYITKPDDKLTVLTNLGEGSKFKKAKERFKLKEEEIDKLSNSWYYRLLQTDFDTYIKKERFEKLSQHVQSDFCLKKPQWFFDNLGLLPKFTACNLKELSFHNQDFIKTHIMDFSTVKIYATMWINMIKYDAAYEEIFLNNTDTLVTATDVREVVRKFPKIIKKINPDMIAKSKLTVKQWILLTDEIIRSNKATFNNWKFKDDVKEIFRMDLAVEVLTGKSKVSKRSQNAMDKVIKITKVEDEESTGTDQEKIE